MTPGGRPPEPKWLSESAVLVMHARQVERYGGAHGARDPDIVGSALARPRNRWASDRGADLAGAAAAYLVGLARTQGFVDGNKRTALACALVFLRLNGHALHVPPGEVYALTMRVAINQIDEASVTAWFRARIEPI